MEYGNDNVVDVAKARCFGLLGVVKTPRPIDCNVGLMVSELTRSVE